MLDIFISRVTPLVNDMKIEINISKKHAYALVVTLAIGFLAIGAFSGPTPSPGHPLSEINVDSDLDMNSHDICLTNECRNTWPSGSVSCSWSGEQIIGSTKIDEVDCGTTDCCQCECQNGNCVQAEYRDLYATCTEGSITDMRTEISYGDCDKCTGNCWCP